MSPRAAWRLEAIGFTKVYDYVGGKADWFAAGLPREGLLTEVPRAGDAARQGDVTCRIDERAGDVVERLRAAAIDFGIVTTDGGVVLGRVSGRDLVGDQEKTLEETMESGPTTIRADTTLDSIIGRLEDRSVSSILVTHSDGRLVGSLYLSDAQSRLDQYQLRQAEQPVNEGECCCMCKAAWDLKSRSLANWGETQMAQNIFLYIQPDGWHFCQMTEEFLSQRGVDFQTRDVLNDPKAMEELIKIGVLTTPVTVIGDEVIVGFDRKRFEELFPD